MRVSMMRLSLLSYPVLGARDRHRVPHGFYRLRVFVEDDGERGCWAGCVQVLLVCGPNAPARDIAGFPVLSITSS